MFNSIKELPPDIQEIVIKEESEMKNSHPIYIIPVDPDSDLKKEIIENLSKPGAFIPVNWNNVTIIPGSY